MHKKVINWKLDRLSVIFRLDKTLEVVADEWSQLAVGKNSDLNIQPELDETKKPHVIFTITDDRRLVIAYSASRDELNIHFEYDVPSITEKKRVFEEIDKFYEVILKISNTYFVDSITDVELGAQLVEYVSEKSNGVKSLRNDFSYFSGIEENIDEINLKIKISESISNGIVLNKNIGFSTGRKIHIKMDSGRAQTEPKYVLFSDILLNIVEDSVSSTSSREHIGILKKNLISIIEGEF